MADADRDQSGSVSAGASGEAGPPLNRMAVALLSLLGALVSLYLLAHSLGWTGPLVCGVGDCATVQSSRWATVGPVPVPAIGLAGYLTLLGVSLMGVARGRQVSRVVPALLLGGATAGFAYSLYLTWLEAAVLRAWCVWCVASALIMTLAFAASLPEAGRLRGRPA